MAANAILHPAIVLVFWTFAVLLLVRRRRFRAAREGKIRARDFAVGESANVPDEVRIPNRNYMNLLELPVLFYFACVVVFVTGKADIWSVGLAWAYVATRMAHTVVHVTYNHVIHRLWAFAASVFVLMALWIRIVVVL